MQHQESVQQTQTTSWGCSCEAKHGMACKGQAASNNTSRHDMRKAGTRSGPRGQEVTNEVED